MKNEIMHGIYRGFKYIVTRQNFNDDDIPSYCCGYIVIDKELMKKLGIKYSSGHDLYDRDMEVTFVYDSDKGKEWDLWFDLPLTLNENVFGFDRGHIYSDKETQADMKSTELLCYKWIDYIISENKKIKNNKKYKRYLISYSHSRGFGNFFMTPKDNDFFNNNNTEELIDSIVDAILETTENEYSRDEIVVLAISNFGELDEMPAM